MHNSEEVFSFEKEKILNAVENYIYFDMNNLKIKAIIKYFETLNMQKKLLSEKTL